MSLSFSSSLAARVSQSLSLASVCGLSLVEPLHPATARTPTRPRTMLEAASVRWAQALDIWFSRRLARNDRSRCEGIDALDEARDDGPPDHMGDDDLGSFHRVQTIIQCR